MTNIILFIYYIFNYVQAFTKLKDVRIINPENYTIIIFINYYYYSVL